MTTSKCRHLIFLATIAVAVPLAIAHPRAQATRTWVSGVGDDVNPCSRTAPCKTFAGAISKTARGGEINVLDSGGFGYVIITKSITIDGTGQHGSVLASGVHGIRINIVDPLDREQKVRIRGLSINGATATAAEAAAFRAGILVDKARDVTIEDTVIDGFTAGIGVAASAEGAQVFVKDTVVRNNIAAGISVAAAKARVALSNVSVLFNGVALEATGGGTLVSFGDNVLFGNTKDGAPMTIGARKLP